MIANCKGRKNILFWEAVCGKRKDRMRGKWVCEEAVL